MQDPYSPSSLLKEANKPSDFLLICSPELFTHILSICYTHKNTQILCSVYLHTAVIFIHPSVQMRGYEYE